MPKRPTVIPVASGSHAYEIHVSTLGLADIGSHTRRVVGAKHIALVSDATVNAIYGAKVTASLEAVGAQVHPFIVPAGEASKTWERAGEVLKAFAEAHLGRDSAVVALGGGVVGDLAGFCAAVYMRGIPVVQAPTTLLGQVDSSIGGKTAVDLPQGKNLVGAFWPPAVVVSGIAALGTLHDREWRSGLGEVAKTGVLSGEDFFGWLEEQAGAVRSRSVGAAERIVVECARFKAGVVSADERESGGRESLNYGHTFGHALEKATSYERFTHGEAVAEGMRFAVRLAVDLELADEEWERRHNALLDALGLRRLSFTGVSGEDFLIAMQSDKKVRGGDVRLVISTAPGVWETRAVDGGVLRRALNEWAAAAARGE